MVKCAISSFMKSLFVYPLCSSSHFKRELSALRLQGFPFFFRCYHQLFEIILPYFLPVCLQDCFNFFIARQYFNVEGCKVSFPQKAECFLVLAEPRNLKSYCLSFHISPIQCQTLCLDFFFLLYSHIYIRQCVYVMQKQYQVNAWQNR